MLARLLFSLAIAAGVAASTYGAAATVIFSDISDDNLVCDPGVQVMNWGLLPPPSIGQVSSVQIGDIDPACIGAEMYVVATSAGTPVGDGGLTLTAATTGANLATVNFTSVGSSTTPVVLSAADITGINVLIHRGSQPATGNVESSCELVGMQIDGWGVDPVSAIVTSVRLTQVNTGCIGKDLQVLIRQGTTVIADSHNTLTSSNTGANVLTAIFTVPGDSTTSVQLGAAAITGIQISVSGESEQVTTPTGTVTQLATGPLVGSPPAPPVNTSQTLSSTSSSPSPPPTQFVQTTVVGETGFTSEVAGARSNGIFPAKTGDAGLLGRVKVAPGITMTPWVLVAGLVLILCGWLGLRRRHRSRDTS